MKKVFFVLVLMLSVVGMNAQTTKTSAKQKAAHATVSVADLPKTITDNITKDYPGFTVKDAKTMTGKNGLNYEVAVVKGTETETLVYDKDGKFLKKLGPKSMTAHHEMKKK